METFTVKIDKQGRLVIPASIRRLLGIEPDSELEVKVEGGRIIIEPKVTNLDEIVDSWYNRMMRRKISTKGLDLSDSKWLSGDFVAKKLGLRRGN